ncbi:MAG: hypothetical protein HZC01_00655 [Candidatus Kerfeldbacteria bacterium]|nr:hypothetical protein [Candidatus Kerfeldbacteria bacterium]
MAINNHFSNNHFSGAGTPGNGRSERIRIDARCPVCQTMYDFNRIEVLQELDGATLMYIKCAVCQSGAMSLIALGSFGLKVASALTDLKQNEVLRFQGNRPVKSEDVLALHQLLEGPMDNFIK